MKRLQYIAAASLASCTSSPSDSSAPTDRTTALSTEELGTLDGWALELVRKPDVAGKVVSSSRGWPMLQAGNLDAAMAAFDDAPDGPVVAVGRARAALAMAELADGLAHLTAEAQTLYVEKKLEAGTDSSHLRVLAAAAKLVLDGSVEPLRSLDGANVDGALKFVRALAGPKKSFLGMVGRALAEEPANVCDVAAPEDDPRAAAYFDAVCKLDVAALRSALAEPLDRETVVATDGESIEVTYYDAVGLRVLADAYRARAVQALDEAKVGKNLRERACRSLRLRPCPTAPEQSSEAAGSAEQVALAEVIFEPQLKEAPTGSPDEAISAAEERSKEWQKAAEQVGSDQGQQIANRLGLGVAEGDAVRMAAADRLLREKACVDAMQLYRLTIDPEHPDAVSAKNTPRLFVRLARSALCAGWNNDATGAARVLAGAVDFAEGPFESVRRAAVADLIGGGGADVRAK